MSWRIPLTLIVVERCATSHHYYPIGVYTPLALTVTRFRTFIYGTARGVDLWVAEIVLDLRANGAAIRLICASPYRGFEVRWSQDWQERYRRVMKQADLVRFICPSYSRDCFQRRNEWMVDHAARVIAVYNGESGGTRNTVAYAKRNGVPVVNVLLKSNSDIFIK